MTILKKKKKISQFKVFHVDVQRSPKAQNIIYPYLLMIVKNLVTYTSLISIHALTSSLHEKCYNIDCRHQTGKAW